MKLTLEEITEAVGGVLISGDTDKPGKTVTSVSTDSREIQPGGLFIALRGDNFDGHDHAAEAMEKGAACVISERELPLSACIRVSSTYAALLDLASYYRDLLGVK